MIGKSKSWAEIKKGRISSKGGDVSIAAASFDETVGEFVFGVAAFEEHDEIVAMKSAVVKREIFACRVTIAISIY